MPDNRKNKVAIVTAASSGLGRAGARALAADGWKLVLMSRSDKINEIAGELGATAMQGDITDPVALEQLVKLAMDTHGRIDGALINTGHAPKGELLEITDEEWHVGLDMVLMPTVRLTRLLMPIFAGQGGGAIVSMSSFAAVQADLTYPLSSAFRAALSSYMKLCVDRHAGQGLRINAVLPGFMDNYPVQEDAVRQVPTGRYGKVQELGETIAFLLSESAGYINGQAILVDGGIVKSI
ncbi:MAG: SDR family oxidoreductase [Marinosulfonomonas sp.]|nr:SDR family oxidoreductase [Marinosulfonomonas sp.]